MHVHIPEQDLLGCGDAELLLGAALLLSPRVNRRLRGAGLADLTGVEGVPFPIALRIRDISWSRLIHERLFRRPDHCGGKHHQQTGADRGCCHRKVSLPHDCSLLFGYTAIFLTAYYSARTL